MNLSSVNEWASLAVSLAALGGCAWTAAKVAYGRGAEDQRQRDLEKRMDAAEARIGKLEDAMSRVPVIEEKLTGMDRMMTRDLDEVKHALRNLAMAVPAVARRKTAGSA